MLYDIVIGDESWIYVYEPESKLRSTEWWSILSGRQPFVCQLFSKKSGKLTTEDRSLKQLHFWALKTTIWRIIRSPDLALNDFFIPERKNVRGQRFSKTEEAVDVLGMHVVEIPQSEWQKWFDNWFKRMQKCIDLNGEYIEKQ